MLCFLARHTNAGVKSDGADGFFVKVLTVDDHLERLRTGAVVEYHKPITPPGADPAHYGDGFADSRLFQQFGNFLAVDHGRLYFEGAKLRTIRGFKGLSNDII